MRGTREGTLRSHIENKGISVNAISVTAHDDAKYMSFKVTVPRSHFDKMFDPDMWPVGVGVRKLYPP